MRIAMFTNNYKPYIAGVPVSIEHLADALRNQGHTVYVFAPSYRNQVEEEFVIRYPSFPVKIAGAPVPNVLTRLFFKKVTELDIDIIHVHHPAIVGNVALSIRKKLGIPVVFTYHTRYEEYLHYVKPLQKFEEYTKAIDWYLSYFCNQCDMIAAPTPGIRTYLLEKQIDTPIGIMPTGIPEDSFRPDDKKASAIREQYLAGADYLFCTVSRLAKEKNLDFQLKALQQLKLRMEKGGKSFRHLIIGGGPEKENLLARIKELGLEENIVLTGNIDNREIKNYQAAADLFLFTSKSETQGIVLLEAMAVGNPVIAVDATGVRDIVENGKNGYMTGEEKDAWSTRILEVLENEVLYSRMRKEAKRTAAAYSESSVAELAELYYVNTCARLSASAQKVPMRRRYVV